MKKRLLLILLFSSFSLFAETLTIKVPIYLEGVMEDTARKNNDHYVYKLNGHFTQFSPVEKKHLKNGTVEKFIESLFYSYKQNDRLFFHTLLSEDTHKSFKERKRQELDQEWEAVRKVKNPIIFYYYDYQDGILISWGSEEIKVRRLIFIKKENHIYKMHKLHIPKNEFKFQNIGLYFNYLPKKAEKPRIESSFQLSDPHYNLTLQITDDKNWIHIFKREGKFWVPKVSVEDNTQGKFKFDDKNPEKGIIEIRFLRSHFTKQKEHNLLILNTNFPVTKIPQELYPKGNLVIN